jgi:hypothetical protein
MKQVSVQAQQHVARHRAWVIDCDSQATTTTTNCADLIEPLYSDAFATQSIGTHHWTVAGLLIP